MIHPIPPGTRDVLPDEMRELRRLHLAMIEVFEGRGYGEVATPAIEYDEVLGRGDGRTAGSAYRFFDERGDLLALRSDMTVPIARLVASRYADAEMPLRLCYVANAFRAVRPQRGQMREFAQAGVELIGAPGPEGTVEVIEVLGAALAAADLPRARIGLGDAGLYRGLLAGMGADPGAAAGVLGALERHDFVALESRVRDLRVSGKRREILVGLPQLRGGPEILDRAVELGGDPRVEVGQPGQQHRQHEQRVRQTERRADPPVGGADGAKDQEIDAGEDPAADQVDDEADDHRPAAIAEQRGAEQERQAEARQAEVLRALQDRGHGGAGDRAPEDDLVDVLEQR